MNQNFFDEINPDWNILISDTYNKDIITIEPEIKDDIKIITKNTVCKYDLKNAKHLVIAEGTEIIYENAFNAYVDDNIDNIDNIKTVIFPSTLKIIEDFAFSNTNIESVTFNGKIIKICKYAFNCCKYLTKIIFNGTIKHIDDFAFIGCNIMGELKLPEGLQYIGVSAFSNNTNIERVIFPDGLETIMAWAFSNCKKIAGDIKIPKSVKYIFEEIFNGCKNIERIFVKEYNNVKYPLWNNKCNAEIIKY